MLKLICGPSGSGKTAALINAIREDIQNGMRCFLLIPEQQAYTSERELATALPENAGLFFETVNFSGLAEDVFRAYGGSARKAAGNGVQSVLMWETLRRLSPLLLQYGKSAAKDASLTAKMLAAVEEFRNNGVNADQLEEAADRLPVDAPLSKKLRDLAALSAGFGLLCEESFGACGSDRLLKAAELLKEHAYFQNCRIYVDSFMSFTVPEYALLRELLSQAEAVTVTLCTDQPLSRRIHFESLSETARRLMRMAKELGMETEKECFRLAANTKHPELRILEEELWDFSLSRENRRLPTVGTPPAIHTTICPNLYEEAEACAIHILGLVQGGMRYSDIAIVVRDPETYRGVLDAALERHKIPYFISERTELSAKPLARLILSALRAVSRNYQAQDIITLLKTGLTGADAKEIALFEEYCETWHLSGKRFLEEAWSMNPDGLIQDRSERANEILLAANRVRKTVIDPLTALSADLKASAKLSDRVKAVYDYLIRLQIPQTLSLLATEELALGQGREAEETLRLYQFTVETLISLSSLLPSTELSAEEFLSLLSLVFTQSDLGSVPGLHDCVVIGSAVTLRVEHLRASFLLGLYEGEFPKAITDDGILTEGDKDHLEALGISLDSRQKLRSSEELFYVYRAMTKPTEQLFLSYPAMQPDGSALTPSLAFSRIGYLFNREPSYFDLSELRRNISQNAEKNGEKPLQAKPRNEQVHLALSQSSVQTFALCPYRYYATYTLGLRGAKSSDLSAADEGTFLHFVFERFLKSSLGENGELTLPENREIPSIADSIIAEYLSNIFPIPSEAQDKRLLHLYERLRELAVLMLNRIASEVRHSAFRPFLFEQRIGGMGDSAVPSVTLELANGSKVTLHGLIDRVDVFEADEKLYVRVVDYKSGKHEFSIDDVRSGLDIQLVLYLFAMSSANTERFVPSGAEYLYACTEDGATKVTVSGFLLNNDRIKEAADQTEDRQFTKPLALMDAEAIEELTVEMQTVVQEIAAKILSGVAEKTPSERACKYCPVLDHCDRAERPKR